MKTEQQIKNLEEALIWWQTVPEANVYPGLRRYTEDESGKTSCGTVACFGGWAGRWPALRKQGLVVNSYGFPEIKNTTMWGAECAQPIFGDGELFYERDNHPADHGFEGSDHELVTNRIRWALNHA